MSGKKTSDCIAHSVFCLIFLAFIVILAPVNLVYGAPTITYNDPAQDNQTVSTNWINVSINSSEAINQSILEWGWANGSASTNFSMINDSVSNQTWSYNVSGLSAGRHNYTIWTLNTSGDWNQDAIRFVTISAISACQNLTAGNVAYTLIQNVNSSGTCFIIGANNITIDGAGYTVNYSQSAVGYAVDNTWGYNLTTVKNAIIVQSNSSVSNAYAIYFYIASNGTIQNNTITISGPVGYGIYFWNNSNSNTIQNNTITTSGNLGHGISFTSSNSNTISNNNITTSGSDAYGLRKGSSNMSSVSGNKITTSGNGTGILLDLSNSNTISNNNITTSGSGAYGVWIYAYSNSNTFSNNLILTSNTASYGVYIKSSSNNNIAGGSIVAQQSPAYYINTSDATNIFTNTNFTAARNISFGNSTSYFKYNNETAGSIWLTTNISAATNITRTLASWTNNSLQWNDTNSTAGVIAFYNITGLSASALYYIYNTSAGTVSTSNLTSDASGGINFTIALKGNTEIAVERPLSITVNSPSNGSSYNNSALSTLVINITTNKLASWCGFSLNGTSNVTMNGTSTSWNGTGISGASVGLNNITFFCNDSRANIVNSTIYFTRDDSPPTITVTPECTDKTTSSVLITWNVSESLTNNRIYYRINSNPSDPYLDAGPTTSTNRPSITLPGLTAGRNYFYRVRSCDSANNCVEYESTCQAASAPTTTTDDSSSTGAGAGGGDTTSGLSKSWPSISSGSTAVFSLTSSSVDVTDIIFKATQALTKVKISVAKLSGKPSATTSTPTGSVYQYVSITPENVTDTKITGTTISFRVNSTWITSNLINSSTIKLYRYSGGTWTALVTHDTGTSGSYKTFIAETPGFSYFAITGKLKGASTPAANTSAPAANQTVNSTTSNNTSIALSTPSSNVTSQSNETVSSSGIFGDTKTSLVVFIVIIIAVVAVLVFHEKLKINLPAKLKLNVPKFYAGAQKTQSSQNAGHKYTFNPSEVKKAELVYKPQPKEEKVKYEYKPKK